MTLLRTIAATLFGLAATTNAIDQVGSTGCTAAACVFANPYLRFGTGSETSVNTWGLFKQPWYFSPTASAWYKLTYSNYPLDTAIGMNDGPNWSGTTVTDLYTLTPNSPSTDYSAFVATSATATTTTGYGTIVAKRTFTIMGQSVTIQNTFYLGANERYVRITTNVTNTDTAAIRKMLIWVGTRDDYVGTTDVNTKTRGNLISTGFVPVAQSTDSSHAIMITNTDEGVLFYSETPGVMTAYDWCCDFSNVYNAYPLSIDPMTPSPTDGSYAAVLPIGDVTSGNSGAIVWYYAAGPVTTFNTVAQQVHVDQVVNVAGSTTSDTPSATTSVTPTISGTKTPTPTRSGTKTPTPTGSDTPSSSATETPTPTGSDTPSSSATETPTPTGSDTPSSSATETPTSTSSPTPSTTETQSSTSSSSATTTGTLSSSPSSSETPSTSPSPSPNPPIQAANNPFEVKIKTSVIIVASTAATTAALACYVFVCLCYKRNTEKCSYCKGTYSKSQKEAHLERCPKKPKRILVKVSSPTVATTANPIYA